MSRIRDLIEEFAGKLEHELKEELRNALANVGFGLGSSAPSPGRAAASNGVSRGRRKGAKRDAGALDALAEKFVNFVAKNPGLRIEQINKELGTTTKNLQLPVRKLLAEGRIKSKGTKRATTYTVGGAAKAKKRAKG
jgi:hypothetical protein